MIRKLFKCLLFTVAFLFFSRSSAYANFDFNINCLKIYQNIIDLKLGAAKQLLNTEKKAHPNNAIVPLLENYWDYFYLVTADSKTAYDRLHDNKSSRLSMIEDEDKNSPYYLYAQAEINLQWGILSGRFGNNYTSAREINKAYNLLQQNAKKYPGYILNNKGLGLINAVLGAMPNGFLKSALATFGIKGNLNQGLAMLEKLMDGLPKTSYEPFYEEGLLYYMFAVVDVAHSPNAYNSVMKYAERVNAGCLLKTYIQAYVCNKTGHADKAIEVLQARPIGANYQPFPYLDYLLGIVKLNKLDYTATNDFSDFLKGRKGETFVKDTYLHLGWIALLRGQDSIYAMQMGKVKSTGDAYLERDKQALNEANAEKPKPTLLKARLLFDGGYLSRALETLTNSHENDFKTARDKAEYAYRMGRVYDDLGKDAEALPYYQNAINIGRGLKYYFAAKSAVLIGKIYAKQKNPAKAKLYFNLAIAMQDHEYENSIENEARMALRGIGL